MLLKPWEEEATGASNASATGPAADVKIAFRAMHAAFAPERKATLGRLRAAIGGALRVWSDHEAKGSLGPWLAMLEDLDGRGYEGFTHVCFLPDDCIVVPHFVSVLTEAVRARPSDIICCQTNHDQAPKVTGSWYTTPDGFTGFGGTMPIELWREHREWRKQALRPTVRVQGDEGVNLWAMATGRLVYKTVPSLVDHDLSVPSLDGNQHQTVEGTVFRQGTAFDPTAQLIGRDWTTEPSHLGRSYNELHWNLITALRKPLVRLAYDIERDRPRAP